MNTKYILLPATVALAALTSPLLAGDNTMAQCPAPVQDSIRQHLDGGTLDEVKTVTLEGRTMFVAEIDRKGEDNDRKIYISGEGTVLKTRDEIPLSAAPAAVQAAAAKLAGTGAKVEDVVKEFADGKTTYEMEIDYADKSTKDIKVVLSDAGATLSQRAD